MGLTSNADRADVLDTAWVSGVITVGTTAVEAKVGASPLANRQLVLLTNLSNKEMWVGRSDVTVSGATIGRVLGTGQSMSLPFGPNLPIYVIASNAGLSLLVWEMS